MCTFRKQLVAIFSLAAAFGLWFASASQAAKPGGGGGGAGTNGGGVIYYWYQSGLYTMNDDGSGKTLLVSPEDVYISPQADPSRLKHGGKRWFVQAMSVDGEFYPNGDSRIAFFAFSEAGDRVALPVRNDFQPLDSVQWGKDDEYLSWVGRTWNLAGEVVEGGLYVSAVTYDEEGVPGLSGSSLLTRFPLVEAAADDPDRRGIGPDLRRFDWSPDGLQIVFADMTRHRIAICDVATGQAQTVFADPVQPMGSPRWSPAGDKVLFNYSTGWNQVTLINPDGSGLKKLVGSSPNWTRAGGVWSPTGSHILYQHWDHFWQDSYIVRVRVGGAGATRLTGPDLGWGFSTPRAMGWR